MWVLCVRVYIFWRGAEKGSCYVAAAELLCLVWVPCSCLLCTGTTGACHHAWLESCCKMLSHHQGLTVKVCTCDPPHSCSLGVWAATQHTFFAEFSCLTTEKFPSRRGLVEGGINAWCRHFRNSGARFVLCKRLCLFTTPSWCLWIIHS